jgi:hypothetical protein
MVSLFCTLHKSLYETLDLLSLLQPLVAVAWYWFSTAVVPLPLGSRTVSALSYQLLTTSESQRLSNLLQLLICPVYNISARTENASPLFMFVGLCLVTAVV